MSIVTDTVVIIGLPGSGKTTFAKTLGGRLVDDATQNEDELMAALRSDGLVVITDVNAVFSTHEAIVALIRKHRAGDIWFICYENDPAACWLNLCERGDDKASRSGLTRMSMAYDVERFEPDMILPVYRP
jgi:broad-specificity NMP kinase